MIYIYIYIFYTYSIHILYRELRSRSRCRRRRPAQPSSHPGAGPGGPLKNRAPAGFKTYLHCNINWATSLLIGVFEQTGHPPYQCQHTLFEQTGPARNVWGDPFEQTINLQKACGLIV